MSFARDLTLVLRARNLASAEVRRLGSDLNSLQSLQAAEAAQMASLGASQLRQGALVTAALGLADLAASKFQGDLVKLQEAGKGINYNNLLSQLVDLSKETGTSVGALTTIAVVAEKIGVEGASNVANFTKNVQALATVSGESGGDLALNIGHMMAALGDAPSKIGNVSSALVELSQHFNAPINDLITMATQIGAAGREAGLTTPQILGLSASLVSAGITASTGGIAVARSLLQVNKVVSEGGPILQEYADVAKMSATQFAQAWKKDPLEAFQALVAGIKSGGGDAQTILANMGFTNVRTQKTFLTLAENIGVSKDAISAASKAYGDGNGAITQAQKAWDDASGKAKQLGQSIVALGATFGAPLLQPLGIVLGVLKAFVNMLGEVPVPIVRLIAIMGTLWGAFRIGQGATNLIEAALVRTRAKSADLAGTIAILRTRTMNLSEADYQAARALAAEEGITVRQAIAMTALAEGEGTATTATSAMAVAVDTLGAALGALSVIGIVIALFTQLRPKALSASQAMQDAAKSTQDTATQFDIAVVKLVSDTNIYIAAQTRQQIANHESAASFDALTVKLIETGENADKVQAAFKDLADTDPAGAQRIIDMLTKEAAAGRISADALSKYKSILEGAIADHKQADADQAKSQAIWGESTGAITDQSDALTNLDSVLKQYQSDLNSTFNTLAGSFEGGQDLGTYLSAITDKSTKAANTAAKAADTSARDITKANQSAADSSAKAWQSYYKSNRDSEMTYDKDIATAHTAFRNSMTNAEKTYQESLQQTRQGLVDTQNSFFDLTRLTNGSVVGSESLSSIKALFADSGKAANEWVDDMKTLMDRGLNKNILDNLKGMGDKALPILRGLMQASASDIADLNKSDHFTATPTKGPLADLAKEFDTTGLTQLQDSERKAQQTLDKSLTTASTSLANNLKKNKLSLYLALADIQTQLQQRLGDIAQQEADTIANAARSGTSAAAKAGHQTLMQFLTQQSADMHTWVNGLSTLMKRGLNAAVIDQLAQLGPKAAPLITKFLGMSKTQLAKVNGLFSVPIGGDTYKALIYLTENLTKMPGISAAQAAAVKTAFEKNIEGFPGLVAASAQDAVDGFGSTLAGTATAAGLTMNQVVNHIFTKQGIMLSTSKTTGQAATTGMTQGTAGLPGVVSTAMNTAAGALSTPAVVKQFADAGTTDSAAFTAALNVGLAAGKVNTKGLANITGSDLLGNLQGQTFIQGENVVINFYNGVVTQRKVGALAGVVLAESFLAGFKGTLGIASPSKVMMGHGLDVVQGFANGIASNLNLAVPSLQKLLDMATKESKQAFDVAVNPIGTPTTGAQKPTNGTVITVANGAVQIVIQVPHGGHIPPATVKAIKDSTEDALTSVMTRVKAGTKN